MLQQIESQLLALANSLPVELFTILGAFIEEIIAPIPSPIVMMTAGVIAFEQGYSWAGLVWISFLGAISKTLASSILYLVADKLENVVVSKFGKFFGVQPGMIEQIGQKLNRGNTDYMTVFLLRATPVVPSAPISILCGLFKVNFKAYLTGTFVGTIVRNMIYLYIGFSGLDLIQKYQVGFANMENLVQTVIIAILLGGILWWKLRKR
jgi:membrane protein DedA with SNARE-associated domain